MIELRHVRKTFRDAAPLLDINITINQGDVISVIGPSGTGKSVLLRCINMLGAPTSGQIFVDGEDITAKGCDITRIRKKIGMVFQSYNLFPNLTVIENIMNPQIKLLGKSKKEAYDKAMELLSQVGLAGRYAKYPDELSGGQKQRVAICRTLAMDPEIILLDEPTSALDPAMTREVEDVIIRLAQTGKTMMVVTHEMRLAKAISSRVIYLDQGVVYEEGTPEEILENPKRERTRAFIEHLKVFKYRFTTGNFSYTDCREAFEGFAERNGLDEKKKAEFIAAIVEIFTVLVPRLMTDELPVSLLGEYGRENDRLKVIMFFRAENESICGGIRSFFEERMENTVMEPVKDKDFNYRISGEIREKQNIRG